MNWETVVWGYCTKAECNLEHGLTRSRWFQEWLYSFLPELTLIHSLYFFAKGNKSLTILYAFLFDIHCLIILELWYFTVLKLCYLVLVFYCYFLLLLFLLLGYSTASVTILWVFCCLLFQHFFGCFIILLRIMYCDILLLCCCQSLWKASGVWKCGIIIF